MFPRWIVGLFFIYVILIGVFFFFVDRDAAYFCFNLSPEIKSIAKSISGILNPQGNLVFWLCLFVVGKFHLKKDKLMRFSFFTALVLAFCNLLTSAIKVLSGRARPALYLKQGIYGFSGFSLKNAYLSFPSGHAATAFAIAMAFALFFPKYRFGVILLAFLFSLTRVALLEHFPSDVIGSALVALIVSVYIQKLFAKERMI